MWVGLLLIKRVNEKYDTICQILDQNQTTYYRRVVKLLLKVALFI